MSAEMKAQRNAVIEKLDGWHVEILLSDDADQELAKNSLSICFSLENAESTRLFAAPLVVALRRARDAIDAQIQRLQ